MDYLDSVWKYCSCYEIHRNYAFMSAFALAGAVMNRKLYFMHGDIEIHSNVYVMLVGPQGNGKTVTCDFAADWFSAACPDLEVGASTQSAEDIVVNMSKDTFVRCYTDENGEQVEVRPYAFFINEFKDFIAYAPTRMLNFLTNIYDRKVFKASTIKRGLENIINPSLNLLACENPDWLVDNLKERIVSGGFSRRIIYVYETDYADPIPFINITPEASKAKQDVIDRLKAARSVVGQYKWAPSGRKFYEPWYIEKETEMRTLTNALQKGYSRSKHIQPFKCAMLVDAVSDKPMLLFTDELLERTLLYLDSIEANMPKLSVVAGRNELAGPQQQLMALLEAAGGVLPEKRIRRDTETNLTPMEQLSVLRHLEDTGQIVRKVAKMKNDEGKFVERALVILPTTYDALVKKGIIVV